MDNRQDRADESLNKAFEPFAREWYKMMVVIWKDKLDQLGVLDTGRLIGSTAASSFRMNQSVLDMCFHFMAYGIYVDSGVGNGYRHDNGGDLQILDKTYRYEHHMGNQRVRKPWFSPSWRISVEVLKDRMGKIAGEQFSGAFDNL